MKYREVLEMSKNCPTCCSKTLDRYMKNKKSKVETTDKDKKLPKK